MIILIRHAQSEGNKNREIHQTVPDHRVKLTPEGHKQSQEAGSKLRELLRPDDTLHFFTSPYRRTRETTEGLLNSLTSDSPSPSPFPRHTVKVYEEPRLREQDFGNFQPCSAEMERMWLERADYGHFFYRIPNGESAADAYDRVSGFNESLWRLFGEDDFASVCVLVTHGLMTRVFLMKWYHWSVEYFEDLRNINHCEFVTMKLNPDNGKYTLQNKLRTWSEMKKEKEGKELERQPDRASRVLEPTPSTPSEGPVPVRRRWGGCPDGCNHGIRRKVSLRVPRANGTDTMRHDHHDNHKTTHEANTNTHDNSQGISGLPLSSTTLVEQSKNAEGDDGSSTEPKPKVKPTTSSSDNHYISLESLNQTVPTSPSLPEEFNSDYYEHKNVNSRGLRPSSKSAPNISRRPHMSTILSQDSEDHLFHPPRTNLALLRLGGRDGGGSMSGMNSLAASEDEPEEIITTKKPSGGSANGNASCHIFHLPRPSQDIGNDGDDEGSESKQVPQRLRRARSHRHNNSNNHPLTSVPTNYSTNTTKRSSTARVGNTLGDQDQDRDREETDVNVDVGADESTHNLPVLDTEYRISENQPCQYGHHREDNHEDNREQGGSDDDLDAKKRDDQSIQGSVY